MTCHSCSNFSSLTMVLVTILIGLALSAETGGIDSGSIDASGFATGNKVRRNSRELFTTMSNTWMSRDDVTNVSAKKLAELSSTVAPKRSIASRTSHVASKTEDTWAEDMGVKFVKPQTAAPHPAPPSPRPSPTHPPSIASTSNGTPTLSSMPSSISSNSNHTTAPPAPQKTSYPTTKDFESIADRTSRVDVDSLTKEPMAASMEFVQPETASPSAKKTTFNHTKSNITESVANSTSVSSKASATKAITTGNTTDTTGNTTGAADDDDVASPDISLYGDDFQPTTAPFVFPKEKDQPDHWPEMVGGTFVVIAICVFGSTAYKNYQKRKDYTELPVKMTV